MMGSPSDAYLGQFYDGPHKFDAVMQAEAFAWLRAQLQDPDSLQGVRYSRRATADVFVVP